MRKRGMIILVVALALAPLGAMAAGQKGERTLSGLNLSAEQLQKARTVRAALKKEMIRIKAEMDIKRIDFHEELQAEEPDKKKLAGLIDDIASLAARKTTARLKMQVDMAQILTAQQKQKLQQRHSSRMFGGDGPEGRARPGGREGHPPPPPPGY